MSTDQDEYQGDPTHHLGDGESIITPERREKLRAEGYSVAEDGQGNIRHASACVMNIMNMLYEHDYITSQQWYDGGSYEIWRGMARAFFSKELATFARLGNETRGTSEKEYGFCLVVRRMSRDDLVALNLALDTFATPHAQAMLIAPRDASYNVTYSCRHRRSAFVQAFHRLSEVMPEVMAELDQIRQRLNDPNGVDFTALLREARIREAMRAEFNSRR